MLFGNGKDFEGGAASKNSLKYQPKSQFNLLKHQMITVYCGEMAIKNNLRLSPLNNPLIKRYPSI